MPLRSRSRRQLTFPLAILALSLATLPGCLVSGAKHTSIHGRPIDTQTVDRIEPGKTEKAWVLATLGEPTVRRTLDTDSEVEVWRYEHRVVRRSGGRVFLLFRNKSRSERSSALTIEFEGDVVQRAWRDDVS